MGINAQTSVPKFTIGDVLTAANTNLLTNAPPVFSGTATRDAAFDGAGEKTLAEGQLCYLESTDVVQYYSGSSWNSVGATDWAAWTPTWANLTVGNATQTARFSQSGKNVFFSLKLVLGSTSSVGTAPTFTWPTGTTAASTAAAQASVVQVVYLDASAGVFLGASDPRNRTTAVCGINGPSGTVQLQDQDRQITSTVPFTWTTSDTIWISGMFEAA